MERLACILIILSLSGSSCSVSKRAFRDLSKKVDLIRTSLQQEIGDMKIEMLDLRNQVESERTRADRLEELLNGTGALPDIDTNTVEDADRGDNTDSTGQATADIFDVMMTAFHREKKRARNFESSVTQKITKVSESFKSGIDHIRRTVVADGVQKSAHDIADIQNELTHIRNEVDVSNDAIVDLRAAVENLTDGAQESARDIEDIQNELTHMRGDVDTSNNAIVDLRAAVENLTDGAQESARDIEDIQIELTHIRHEAAASKDDITDLQDDLPMLHAEAKKSSEQKEKMTDCSNLYASGTTQSGVYTISPSGGLSFSVYCDMTDGGWTVIQRRIDGALSFKRTWDEYVNGFGDVNGEFWLGLEKIHRLTKDVSEIYFDIGNYDGTREYAHYKSFIVHDEATLYKMNVDANGYDGSIAELFSKSNDMKFSTYDMDNDAWGGHCAQYEGGDGGWWYGTCGYLSINGVFGKKASGGISYFNNGFNYVKTVTIKLK